MKTFSRMDGMQASSLGDVGRRFEPTLDILHYARDF